MLNNHLNQIEDNLFFIAGCGILLVVCNLFTDLIEGYTV